MSPAESLTIVLPAYNEADRIGPALDELFGYLRRRGEQLARARRLAELPAIVDVVVVDDGSTDGTAALVAARPEAAEGSDVAGATLRVHDRPARRQGSSGPGGDAGRDLGHRRSSPTPTWRRRPDQIPLLVARPRRPRRGARFADPARWLGHAREPARRIRRMLGKVFHCSRRSGSSARSRTPSAGSRGSRRAAAQDLFSRQQVTSIVFDVELIYLARRRGDRIAIVPVRWEDRRGSRMRARPGLALRVAWDLFRIPLLHRRVRRVEAVR